jgi:peroxiredoxin
MEESVTLKTGDYAPDFELPAVTGTERQKFKLSDWRGKKNVVLAFYALDWSPT